MTTKNIVTTICLAVLVVVLGIANRHVFIPTRGEAIGVHRLIPLPKTWPGSYPIYPTADYLGRDAQQGQVGGRWYDRAWFESHADAKAIIRWYDSRLPAAGYKPIATRNTGYSKQYGFAVGKRVVDMEIFINSNKPTDISVDFLPPK